MIIENDNTPSKRKLIKTLFWPFLSRSLIHTFLWLAVSLVVRWDNEGYFHANRSVVWISFVWIWPAAEHSNLNRSCPNVSTTRTLPGAGAMSSRSSNFTNLKKMTGYFGRNKKINPCKVSFPWRNLTPSCLLRFPWTTSPPKRKVSDNLSKWGTLECRRKDFCVDQIRCPSCCRTRSLAVTWSCEQSPLEV